VPDGADGVEGIDWCIVLPLRFRSFVCLFEQHHPHHQALNNGTNASHFAEDK
jgi:hypothetical protein